MPNRSSSRAEFFGYTLTTKRDEHSDVAGGRWWRSEVYYGSNFPVPDAIAMVPWISQTEAEKHAETTAREHAKAAGNELPGEAKPSWRAK